MSEPRLKVPSMSVGCNCCIYYEQGNSCTQPDAESCYGIIFIEDTPENRVKAVALRMGVRLDE